MDLVHTTPHHDSSDQLNQVFDSLTPGRVECVMAIDSKACSQKGHDDYTRCIKL